MHWEIKRLYDALSDLLVDARIMLKDLEDIYEYDNRGEYHEPVSMYRAHVILQRVKEFEDHKNLLLKE